MQDFPMRFAAVAADVMKGDRRCSPTDASDTVVASAAMPGFWRVALTPMAVS